MDRSIKLRLIEETDAPNVQKQVSDIRIADTCGVPYPYPEDGAVKWTKKVIEEFACGLRYPFVILSNDNFSGFIELELLGRSDGEADLGYWVSVHLWNQGIATEACRQIINYAFEKVGLSYITSRCLVRNPSSSHVLEKNGFQETGIKTDTDQSSKFLGERWRLFRLTKKHWEQAKCEPTN